MEEARAGRYAEALASYDRHLRSGAAQPIAYTNSARDPDGARPAGRGGGSLPRSDPSGGGQRRPGRQRDEGLALALYGLGVALDRDDQEAAAREAMARATALDPRLRLLDPEAAGGDVFFVPPGDLHYYRGLALRVLARREEAAEAFRRFVKEVPAVALWRRGPRPTCARWRRAAGAGAERAGRDRAAAGGGGGDPAMPDGPLPAPLVDATLKGQTRLLRALLRGGRRRCRARPCGCGSS